MAKSKKRVEGIDVSTGETAIPKAPRPPSKKKVDTIGANVTLVAQPDGAAVNQESTMSDSITIQGFAFAVPVPYAEGHVLTAGEASALNQVFHENLRNNFASKIKKLKEANGEAIDVEALQADLDAYAKSYQFGVRTTGGTRAVTDPVKREAINLAKEAIKAALRSKGKSVKDAGGNDWLVEKATELVATRPVFMEQAKARVSALQALASDTLEG